MSDAGARIGQARAAPDGEAVRLPWRAAHVSPAVIAGLDRFSAGLFALFIVGLALIAVLVPERNWDKVAYVALTIEDQYETPEALHAATWKIIRDRATDEEFNLLTTDGAYRQAQFADASNFVSQLPMYRVKVGYIALLKTLAPALGPVGAIRVINVVSVLLLGACLLLWMRRSGVLQGALFLAPLMLLTGAVDMARLGAPDMLVAALSVAGTMLLTGRKPWSGVPLLIAAFLVRPDTLIFLFALVLAGIALRWRTLPALTAFLISAALTVPLSNGADHIGWWPHFWFSTVEMQNNMAGFNPDFSAIVYLKGVARGLAISVIQHGWLAAAVLLLLAAWFVIRRRTELPREIAMPMLGMVLAVGGKFVVFPLPDDRIYAVFLWMFALGVLALWKPNLIETRNDWAQRP
ncbi:MAG TPA: hypothetical protein VMF90_17170 [Rhizobiaceae bacterium]|nr:hypothetical protein [Rhizobiaceae bacterium]